MLMENVVYCKPVFVRDCTLSKLKTEAGIADNVGWGC